MANAKRKIRRRVRVKKSVQLVHKNDATRVDRPDTVGLPRMKARPPADTGVTFKLKFKKKK